MSYEDTERGVRSLFYPILDLPEVAVVQRICPGMWFVRFGDGSEATAYPLEGRFEEDPTTVKKRRF